MLTRLLARGCFPALALLAFLGGSPPVVARAAAGMAVLITWKHRANLQRIARGTENRLGRKAAPAPAAPTETRP